MQHNLQNKKLSYRRDSARRPSSCRSRSFKVTNVSTNRKSYWWIFRTVFQLSCSGCLC